MNILNWKFISKFGNNKLIQRSYIYLFLVPTLVKILAKINGQYKLIIFETEFEIIIGLPFSWQVFYFAALSFTIGSILFQIYAPSIIKENNSLADFVGSKKELPHILKYLDNLNLIYSKIEIKVNKLINPENKYLLMFSEREFLTDSDKINYNIDKALIKQNINVKKSKLIKKEVNTCQRVYKILESYPDEIGINKSFWIIYDFAEKYNIKKLYWTFAIYMIGFLLLFWVFGESMLTVLKMIIDF